MPLQGQHGNQRRSEEEEEGTRRVRRRQGGHLPTVEIEAEIHGRLQSVRCAPLLWGLRGSRRAHHKKATAAARSPLVPGQRAQLLIARAWAHGASWQSRGGLSLPSFSYDHSHCSAHGAPTPDCRGSLETKKVSEQIYLAPRQATISADCCRCWGESGKPRDREWKAWYEMAERLKKSDASPKTARGCAEIAMHTAPPPCTCGHYIGNCNCTAAHCSELTSTAVLVGLRACRRAGTTCNTCGHYIGNCNCTAAHCSDLTSTAVGLQACRHHLQH